MANHVSSLKRARQDIKKRDRNRAEKSSMRTALKRVHDAIASGQQDVAQDAFLQATSFLARAGQKNIIHAKQASRRISRLNASIKAMAA
ncbi:MAG: 30S ribosomal protein S20 [Mariprofundaceae bacterium]|nr:30S ribosomal protein S20 [Mariprofundaceae bacterium]